MKLTEKQKNCPYCHYDFDGIPVEQLETEGNLDIEAEIGGTDIYLFNTGDYATIPINYCPMCGRPLNEEEE